MHRKQRGAGCQPWLRWQWLLVASYLLAAPCSCIEVSSSAEFAQAFARSTDIVLLNDITINADNWATFSAEQPCTVDRDFTVSSAPGALYRLDYLFLQAKCSISPGVTVTYDSLELANTRYGSGQNIDFFAASPNGTVLLRNVVRRRPACAPNRVSAVELQKLPRPAAYPGTQDVTTVPQICANNECFQNAVLFNNFATESAVSADQLQYGGGYDILNINTTMACAMLVPNSCIVARGPDRCVIDVISSILMPVQPETGGGGVKALAIVLPIVAALLVVALVTGALLWRRKKRQRLHDEERAKGFEQSSGAASGMNVLTLLNSNTPRAAEGWRMMAHRTALDFQSESHDRIALGVLIGVGGHGRVYKGQWQGREVAVKVLQHNAANAHRVARECDLIMGFTHQYIVRAYHFVTWCQGDARVSHPSSSTNISRPFDSAGPLISRDTSQPSQQQLKASPHQSPHPSGSNAIQQHASASNFVSAASGYATAAGGVSYGGRGSGSSAARGSGSIGGGRGSVGGAEYGVMQGSGLQGSGILQVTATSVSDEELDAQTWIVTEYCDGGSLYDMNRTGRLSHPDGTPALEAILYRLQEVADAMTYLHASKVLHGDLKSANVLCTTAPERPYGVVAKVSDFGLSSMLVDGQTHKSTRTMGTVTHMAPETLRSGKLMPASDVYSFGILMWELISSKSAFSGKHYGEIIERVLVHNERPPIPPNAPEDYVLLMSSCWESRPKLRPTFEAVRQCLDIMLAQRQEEQQQMAETAAQVAATVAANPQHGSSGSTFNGSSYATSGQLLYVSGGAGGAPMRSPINSGGRPPRPPADEQEQRQASLEETSGFF